MTQKFHSANVSEKNENTSTQMLMAALFKIAKT